MVYNIYIYRYLSTGLFRRTKYARTTMEETMKLFASKNISIHRLKCSQNYYIDRTNNKTEGFNNKLQTTLE